MIPPNYKTIQFPIESVTPMYPNKNKLFRKLHTNYEAPLAINLVVIGREFELIIRSNIPYNGLVNIRKCPGTIRAYPLKCDNYEKWMQ